VQFIGLIIGNHKDKKARNEKEYFKIKLKKAILVGARI
jgi:hypothetical protein